MWIKADLQAHCSFHDDGWSTPEQLWQKYGAAGYDVVYLTPHADLIGGHWAELGRICRSLPRRGPRIFVGLEVAVVGDRGHLLAYGLPDTRGLENQVLNGPSLAARVAAKGDVASFSVAHPFGRRPWNMEENPLTGSFGLEIMSGFQTEFSLQSASTRLWRQLWRNGAAVSARTGSDWHGGPFPLPTYTTLLRVPLSWRLMTWATQKYLVDLALLRGWTVVSKNGSLAVLKLRGRPPGSAVPAEPGDRLEFDVWFRPRTAGRYRLLLIRDDDVESPLWQKEVKVKEPFPRPYTWAIATYFAGSVHYYWLYGEGSDYLYTTPILVVTSGLPAAGKLLTARQDLPTRL